MTGEPHIRGFEERDEPAVIGLWHACDLVVPWNDPATDIALKLRVQRHLFLVGCVEDRIIASVMAGYDGHRGWINYLAVHPDWRRCGFGRRLMERAEWLLRIEGCPKVSLQVRDWNDEVIAFYQRLGYARDRVVSYGKWLDGRLPADSPR